jgi:citrate lyase subunit beta/citryl-CoA lyase
LKPRRVWRPQLLATYPRVCRLVFGNLDFQTDVGMACGVDEGRASVRLALVLASCGRVRAPVDGVTASTSDTADLTGQPAQP